MIMPPLKTEYLGAKGGIFRLALKTGFLTVLTLGFYRFWMKTRLRRYYWSAIRPGGAPLEYTGTPWEKLLGFLVAVVVLAFYIGVVNLILMFISFSFFQGNFVAYVASFIGVLPLIFFAQYRARRYILARTRWRGIRFGLEPGAWGYAWRAMLYWVLVIISVGILWPLKAFRLEKYLVDRTFYGSERFEQGGRWTMLLGPMKHAYIAAGLVAVPIGLAALTENEAWVALVMVGGFWASYAGAHWRAESWRVLAENKSLGGIRFQSTPRPWSVFGIWMLGGFLIQMLIFVVFIAIIFGVVALLIAGGSDDLDTFMRGFEMGAQTLPAWMLPLFGVGAYFSIFLMSSALMHTFITLPIAQHFAEETEILNPEHLPTITQRARDEFAEAEGFADALDVGAAL